mmetsp:Transcript_17211/g.51545  ORF Transcript_17211/g.51545 Transcript_17211/m.51545 type:complete len:549 (-) Transcript_17211:30-1676(-)
MLVLPSGARRRQRRSLLRPIADRVCLRQPRLRLLVRGHRHVPRGRRGPASLCRGMGGGYVGRAGRRARRGRVAFSPGHLRRRPRPWRRASHPARVRAESGEAEEAQGQVGPLQPAAVHAAGREGGEPGGGAPRGRHRGPALQWQGLLRGGSRGPPPAPGQRRCGGAPHLGLDEAGARGEDLPGGLDAPRARPGPPRQAPGGAGRPLPGAQAAGCVVRPTLLPRGMPRHRRDLGQWGGTSRRRRRRRDRLCDGDAGRPRLREGGSAGRRSQRAGQARGLGGDAPGLRLGLRPCLGRGSAGERLRRVCGLGPHHREQRGAPAGVHCGQPHAPRLLRQAFAPARRQVAPARPRLPQARRRVPRCEPPPRVAAGSQSDRPLRARALGCRHAGGGGGAGWLRHTSRRRRPPVRRRGERAIVGLRPRRAGGGRARPAPRDGPQGRQAGAAGAHRPEDQGLCDLHHDPGAEGGGLASVAPPWRPSPGHAGADCGRPGVHRQHAAGSRGPVGGGRRARALGVLRRGPVREPVGGRRPGRRDGGDEHAAVQGEVGSV